MATFTSNHDFGRPIEGGDTDDWGRILNEELIDLLEERVVISDTAANRSTYTAYADAVFIATDTGQWALGDGTSWNDIDVQPATHSTTHENGGVDEISVTGLSGDLADPQDPKTHSTTHENGGADEISVTGLSGDLADAQDPKAHSTTHESGGADQLSDLTLTVLANQDYNESVTTLADASGTTTIDLSTANYQEVLAIGNVTVAFSNVTGTPPGNSITIYFEDSDGAGPYTISWPASVVWSNGSAVTEIAANSNVEVSLVSPDGGTTWRARKSGEAFA